MGLYGSLGIALLAVLHLATSNPIDPRDISIGCPDAPLTLSSDAATRAMEFSAYVHAVTVTDNGCSLNQTMYNAIVANWLTDETPAAGPASLAKRLDEGIVLGDGRTKYLGWIVTIWKSYIYYYRSTWAFPRVENFSSLSFLQDSVTKQMARWADTGFAAANIAGGWHLSVQTFKGYTPKMMPESLVADMIRSLCFDAYSWLADKDNGAYWEVRGSSGLASDLLYTFLLLPTDAVGTDPVQAHEDL